MRDGYKVSPRLVSERAPLQRGAVLVSIDSTYGNGTGVCFRRPECSEATQNSSPSLGQKAQ